MKVSESKLPCATRGVIRLVRVIRRRTRKPPMLPSILWLELRLCFCGNRVHIRNLLSLCKSCLCGLNCIAKYLAVTSCGLSRSAFAHLLAACGSLYLGVAAAWDWFHPPPSAQDLPCAYLPGNPICPTHSRTWHSPSYFPRTYLESAAGTCRITSHLNWGLKSYGHQQFQDIKLSICTFPRISFYSSSCPLAPVATMFSLGSAYFWLWT